MLKSVACIGVLASSLSAGETFISGSDTLHCYEKQIAASPSEDMLRVYLFPDVQTFAGEELATRTMSDSLPLIHRARDASFSLVLRTTYETVEEVFEDSLGNETRLGLSASQVMLETAYEKTLSTVTIEASECTRETAPGDTLVRGPYQGRLRCASYLPSRQTFFSAADIQALLARTYAANKVASAATRAAIATKDSLRKASGVGILAR